MPRSPRQLIPAPLRPAAERVADVIYERRWRAAGFPVPAPRRVKWAVLDRHSAPGDTWIETGTYVGDTTAHLARRARHVYTIEPAPHLAAAARDRFAGVPGVTVLEGLSEDLIGPTLDRCSGPLSLWLDGHHSGGITHLGPHDTAIVHELQAIEDRLDRFETVSVLVDDVRCFDPSGPYSTYPTRGWLVEWAQRCGMPWTIEHDIFVATRGR